MAGIYRFINTSVPTKGCNLRCEYCYVRQHGDENLLDIDDKSELYKYSISHMLKALTVERMGGVCMFNFSAEGETLLSPNLYEIVVGLIENGHYVAIISNCTVSSEIDEYIKLDKEKRSHLFFKASFHYRELKKRDLLVTYANNIDKLKKNEVAYSIELVSNDYVIDELDEVKTFCMEKFGALPHILGGREESVKGKYPKYETKLSEKDFYEVWGTFKSPLFEFQDKEYLTPHNNDFCYAGVYTGTFDLSTGNFSACPGNRVITNFFDNIEDPIQFLPVGNKCPFPFCFCGFFLQVLAGSCSDSYALNYKFYEFRDRICSDGSTWLTPSIREIFSHTCSEYHDRVNEEQAYVINSILDVVYHGFNGNIDMKMTKIIGDYFKNNSLHNVAIYGMGDLGKMLLFAMDKYGINVICGIDKKYKDIISDIQIVSPDDIPSNVDTVVVSTYGYYPSVSKYIKQRYPIIEVISILDILKNNF